MMKIKVILPVITDFLLEDTMHEVSQYVQTVEVVNNDISFGR